MDIGHRSEAAIWGRLVKHGYAVLLPCGVNQRYDLVIDDAKGFLRVQCKTGRLKNGGVEFRTCSTRSNTRSAMARDYVGEIDLFGVYCPENNGVYLVPSEGLLGGGCLSVSTCPATVRASAYAGHKTTNCPPSLTG